MRRRGAFRGTMIGTVAGLCLAVIGWAACPDAAAETTASTKTGLLRVDGTVAGGKAVTVDLATLKSLPAITVKTTTPWTDQEDAFEGVLVRDLLDHFGAKGSSVVAYALDDYMVTIPMEDFRDYDVIIAYAIDGKPLPLDDKGPFWIIYPFSATSALQTDIYFSRSVWQLNRLTVQ